MKNLFKKLNFKTIKTFIIIAVSYAFVKNVIIPSFNVPEKVSSILMFAIGVISIVYLMFAVYRDYVFGYKNTNNLEETQTEGEVDENENS